MPSLFAQSQLAISKSSSPLNILRIYDVENHSICSENFSLAQVLLNAAETCLFLFSDAQRLSLFEAWLKDCYL